MKLADILKKIEAQQPKPRVWTVRVEVRGREVRHEFTDIIEAMRSWDKWSAYGLCIDPRPSL